MKKKRFYMKKILCAILVLCMVILPIVGCSEEPFEVQSCGSGFYFNRSNKNKYRIKELDAVSDGNYFYLEDYFCSDTLGEEYEIKSGIFTVGTVRLAKKSDYYNLEKFEFDVMEYNNRILAITPDMQYVRLYSGEEGGVSNLQIQIMPDRELPLDITLDGVRIQTEDGIPTIFSSALTDVNFILIGENELYAGAQKYTLEEIVERANNQIWSEQEKHYYEALEELEEGKDSVSSGDGGEALEHFFRGVTDLGKGVVDSVVGGVSGLIDGFDGFTGADGAISVILPAGVSFSGEGTLSVKGGDGAQGGAATGSLLGRADGGDGGDGGDGIFCGAYLDVSGNVSAEGGFGGNGGSATSGLFGSSGSDGAKGEQGVGVNAAIPRETED